MVRLRPIAAATEMVESTANYQPCSENDNSASPLCKILVYTPWNPTLYGQAEAHLAKPRPQNFPLDPLIWGALFTVAGPHLRKLSIGLVCLGFAYLLFILPTLDKWLDESIKLALFLVIIALGYLTEWYLQHRLVTHLQQGLAELAPTLKRYGYSTSYEIEATGECYYREHRIYVYANRTSLTSEALLQQLLHDAKQDEASVGAVPDLDDEPVRVYLHVSRWRLFCRRLFTRQPQPIFMQQTPGQPPAKLARVHPFLYAGLQNACYEGKLESMRIQDPVLLMFFSIYVLVVGWGLSLSDMATFILTVLPAVFVVFLIGECLMSSHVTYTGHDQWERAAAQWKEPFLEAGYRLEYHYESAGDYYMQFVPVEAPSNPPC